VHDHHYLQPLIEPRAVAAIGASERSGSLGYTVIRNLLESGFTGRLFAVNPKHKTIFDLPSYPSIKEVPHRVDLAFAIVVADAWQHRGVARKLMQVLIETARNRSLKEMRGVFLANNERMLRFVASLGFTLSDDPEDRSIKHGVLPLQTHL